MLNLWLKEALRTSNKSQAALSRELSERLKRSIDRAAINKMLKGPGPGGRAIYADELLAIAEITGVPAPAPEEEYTPDSVPVVGYVGAGAAMIALAEGQSPDDFVPAPEGATEKTVAVEVRGESLGVIFDRWLVYYDDVRDPVTPDLIGHLCVCGLADGRVLVKMVKAGQLPGRYTLLSNAEPPIYDAAVIWAARVKQMSPR